MGLSIHYSGRLKEANLLPALIEEVKDVAEVYGWKCRIYGAAFPQKEFSVEKAFDEFYGVSFTPTNCETISLTFLSNGVMICPARAKFFAHSPKNEERSWVYTNSVKTQYAGVVIHQLIIHFFRYLNSKYFSDFKMFDESSYWETNDEEKMKEQFKTYDILLDNFVFAVEAFPVQKDESISAYFERLMKYIDRLRK